MVKKRDIFFKIRAHNLKYLSISRACYLYENKEYTFLIIKHRDLKKFINV